MNPNDNTNPHYTAPSAAPVPPSAMPPAQSAPIIASAQSSVEAAAAPVVMPVASNLNPALPPTYSDMLKEMGKQLNNRKGLLFKRVLLIMWPFLLAIVFGYIIDKIGDSGTIGSITGFSNTSLMAMGAVYLVFAAVYVWIAGFIFEIEKQIWIDSHFDKKDLTPKQSWSIARKLFWPAFKLRLRIAWNYYFLPAIVFAAVLVGIGFLVSNTAAAATYASNIWILALALFLVFLVVVMIYSYYIKVKLRYAWFVFLDIYKGNPFDARVVLSQMNALNAASKSASFKKALIAEIGTDSANVIGNLAVSTIGFGISQVPGVGQLLGGLTRAYGQELTRQAASLGKISAMYLLYRYARKELFGSEQVNNDYVYNLIGPSANPSVK